MKIFCHVCGTQANDDRSLFCSRCGTRLIPCIPPKNEDCPYCGTKILDRESIFCLVCGNPLPVHNAEVSSGFLEQDTTIPAHEQVSTKPAYSIQPRNEEMRPPMVKHAPGVIKTTVKKEVTWITTTEWINESSPPSPSHTVTKLSPVSPSGSGSNNPPEKEFNNLIFGVIILVFIIICLMLITITSSLNAQDSPTGISPGNRISSSAPLTLSPNQDSLNTGSMIKLIPTTLPPGNSAAKLPDAPLGVTAAGRSPVSGTISAYVTIEPKSSPAMETHVSLQPSIAQNYGEGYVTIYSLTNQNITQVLPVVSFTLLNPPLVIDYNLTPLNQVRIKHVEYKKLDTYYEENLEINRPYENSWLRIIVRNKDTGEVLEEDGIGRNYSFQTPKQMIIRELGNYSFEFTGGYGVLTLTMKVKQDGNFPPATQLFESRDVQVTLTPIPSVLPAEPSMQPTPTPTLILSATTVVPSAQAGTKSIMETAEADSRLTTVVTAIRAAELNDTLSGNTGGSSEQFTVFAPTDDAFKKLQAGSVDTLLKNPQGDLLQILLYHVIKGKLYAADLRKLTSVETLQGGPLPISVSNGVITVDGANVIITDINCSNGVIHLIDTVMLPPA